MIEKTAFVESDKTSSVDEIEITVLSPTQKQNNTLLFFYDQQRQKEEVEQHAALFTKDHNVLALYKAQKKYLSTAIVDKLSELNYKRINLISYGSSFEQSVDLILTEPSLFRRVMFVDPIINNKESVKFKFINFLEKFIPFGLPFYYPSGKNNLSNNLIRLRLPVLIFHHPELASCQKKMFLNIPNAKQIKLHFPFFTATKSINLEALKLILDFLQQPVKRSQKPGKS